MEKEIKIGVKSTLIGLIVNSLLAVVKIVSGFFGNSYALIADGIESTADVVNSIIVIRGLKISQIPQDDNHPYGHGKAEPIAAMIVSVFMIGAAIMIMVQSIYEIVTPHRNPKPFTLVVLAVVIIVKEFMFRKVLKVSDDIDSISVKTDAWHHRSDAMTSAAAFIGIGIALYAGSGYENADDWAALFAGLVIMYNAYSLTKDSIDELMDSAPPAEFELQVRNIALKVPGVIDTDKCLLRKSGFKYFIDLHVVVDAEISVHEGHKIGHQVKDKIITTNPRFADVLVHIEPFQKL